MADLTHLDAKGMQTFVDNDVADFIEALKDIRKDAPNGKALRSALEGYVSSDDEVGLNKFLVIGGLPVSVPRSSSISSRMPIVA